MSHHKPKRHPLVRVMIVIVVIAATAMLIDFVSNHVPYSKFIEMTMGLIVDRVWPD